MANSMSANKCSIMNASTRDASGYLPIEHYGMIGNMRTCALVSMDGSIGEAHHLFLFSVN